jgi:peptide/nickel transport system substrate-binding protein
MKRKVAQGALMLLFMAMMIACSKPEAETEQADKKQGGSEKAYEVEVIRMEGGDWGYPTPFAHYPRGPGGFKMALIFDSLLERDEKGLISWLAESWRIEDEGLTYRFFLRPGIKWQDGASLTAEDVTFSISYANRHSATWSYVFDAISSVGAESDREVRVRLKVPQAIMLDGIGRTRIIPKHIWEKVERPKEFTAPEALIGCGPYRLTDYSKEHGTYRFEAFEGFWGPKPRVRVIEYVPAGEPVLAYEKNEIDIVGITPDLLPRFQKDPANKIIQNPAFWGYRLLMNMEKVPILRDVRVRQALAYAIDRQELVDKIARGAAVPGSMGILPPEHVMAAEEIRQYPFVPEQARALLDHAGLRQTDAGDFRITADGAPLFLELLCSAQEIRMAELIQQRLKEVGIGVNIRSVDGKTRDSQVRVMNYQVAIIGHGGWGQDPNYLVSHLAGDVFDQNTAPSYSGLPGLDAPELMDLLKRQAKEINSEKRRRLIVEIQNMAADLVPEIPLYYTTGYTAYRPAKYDGWMNMFDHHSLSHGKLSYLERTGPAVPRTEQTQ